MSCVGVRRLPAFNQREAHPTGRDDHIADLARQLRGRFPSCREAPYRDAAHHLCLNGIDDQNIDVLQPTEDPEVALGLR